MTGVKETEIAKGAADWLEERGYEVFQEVRGPNTNRRVDVVGRVQGSVVTVEAKVSLGLAVIAQAANWYSHATETWVAVPRVTTLRHDTFALAREICESRGVGILAVGDRHEGFKASVAVGALVHGRDVTKWNACLHPQQKESQGWSQGGGYSTEFSRTCQALVETVTENGGSMELKAAMKATKHHYSRIATAVQSFSGCLNAAGTERSPHLSRLRIEGKGTKAMVHLNDPGDF